MKIHTYLLASLLLAACSSSETSRRENPLQGAWVLSKVEYPMGGVETFPVQGMRPLRLYEGDSMMLQCGLTRTASAMVVHQPYFQSNTTLIDKGGGEYVYLEDDDPRPLTVVDDTTMTIQRNGILYTWRRADEIAEEWGEEICAIITDNLQGEYACAEIALTKDGKCVVMPHEYGTYSLKDEWYSEMGRPAIKDAITWIDKTTTKGTWMKRHDIWKKQSAMPEKLTRYIVECCKVKNTPDDIQQLLKQTFFK